MRVHPWTQRGVVAVVLSVSAGLACGAADIPDNATLPRYRLTAGDEFVYTLDSRFTYGGGTQRQRGTYTVWIAGENPDGSWPVVMNSSTAYSFGDGDGESNAPRNSEIVRFTLYPDGRTEFTGGQSYMLDPASLFPALPASLEEARSGWRHVDAQDAAHAYAVGAAPKLPDGVWVIDDKPKTIFDKIYDSSTSYRIHFDARKGVVTKIESESRQGYGVVGSGMGTIELQSATQHDAAWLTAFAADAERYFAVAEESMTLLREAGAATGDVSAELDRVSASYKSALADVSLDLFKDQITAKAEQFDGSKQYHAEQSAERAKYLDQASPDWNTTDFDGTKYSLEGFGGKVLLLDFWYRGCGWCIRAMPQLNELADAYRGKPVAVIGMNIDQNDDDATFVMDAMKLSYLNVKGEEIDDRYGVRGYPTLIVIDRDGVVRHFHVGYSPTLNEELSKVIDELLAE